MVKIRRKVVLHGNSTLTVSLPSSWVKKFNIRKGDELYVLGYGKELRIHSEHPFGSEKKEVNIGNLERMGKSYITSLYRSGYDEIHINYADHSYIGTIQDLLSKEMIGFEIIKQANNYCLMKDLTGHIKDEFNTALRRIWLLISDLSKESINAIKNNDIDALKHIHLMDNSINKFSNYCLRILSKRGHINFKKTHLYHYLIKNLEEIADQYKDLCNLYLNNKSKINTATFMVFIKVNEHFNEFYELFYKYDEQRIEDLFKKTKSTQSKISDLNHGIAYYLSSICRDIRNLLSTTVEINL